MKTTILILISFLFINSSKNLIAQVTFTDVAESLGIDHTYYWPFFNAGLSFCDFDKDGLEDLTLPTVTGEKIHIYKFNGENFTNIVDQTDISDTQRVDCVLWADYDNDGDRDFLITNRNSFDHLYRNDNGEYVDVTSAVGLPLASTFSTAACWADYDKDGWLDLYIGTRDWNLGSHLYHNNGDGTFTDVTDFAGVSNFGKLPLAISFLDYDNDGWLDIYNANDLHQGNTLFKNNGDGTFTDVSVVSGANVYVSGMGIAIGDYDNNGFLDMYITNVDEGNAFLHNNGDGTFTEIAGYLHIDVGKFGWGTSFFDYDNDGDLDLLVNNSGGLQGRDDPARNNTFFRNNGDGQFTELFDTGLEADTFYSYGSATADFNNDGYLDVAILNAYGHKSQLFQNSGGTNNWIKIGLEGTVSNREGIGSVIEIWRSGTKFIRTTHCGVSYQSQNSFVETIGVGQSTVIDSIIIKWPNGIVDVYRDVLVNQKLNALEGETLLQPNPVTFSDVSSQMKVNHSYNIDFFAGGVSFADANGDGLDDITFSSAMGENIQHLRNKTTTFKNIVNKMGISELGISKAVIWADYDNDRDKDLFVVNLGSVSRLYRNDRGIFTDVTNISGLSMSLDQSTGASFADYDNDGFLDLYVGNRDEFQGNRLYHNNGDGTFTEVTETAKVTNTGKLALTVSWLDFNNDGFQDIYCANDLMKGNTLFKNNGDGTFIDISASSGVDLQMACMGIAVGDYNDDGWVDMYLTNGPDGNRLLKNNGNNTFSEVAGLLGINIGKICWGSNFIDYDNDGDLDLFVCVSNGISGNPTREDILFWNKGNGTFAQALTTGIESDTSFSYGNAIGDYNNDGYSDIVILNANGTQSKLLKNNGWTNNWIKINLKGVVSNRDGIGSKIAIYAEGKVLYRWITNEVSYQSQNSLTQIAGLGTATLIDSIIVNWPSGQKSKVTSAVVNQTLTITEAALDLQSGLTTEQMKKEFEIPEEYSLNQNYPNPFNPTTTISYQLKDKSEVKIEIFDILGRKIRQIESGLKSAGFYELLFNAESLPSGVYVYRVFAKSLESEQTFTESKKMILMR